MVFHGSVRSHKTDSLCSDLLTASVDSVILTAGSLKTWQQQKCRNDLVTARTYSKP
jgi:hypothetical protein